MQSCSLTALESHLVQRHGNCTAIRLERPVELASLSNDLRMVKPSTLIVQLDIVLTLTSHFNSALLLDNKQRSVKDNGRIGVAIRRHNPVAL